MIIAPIKEGFKITQRYGENPKIYARFGLKAHNGCDYGVPIGTNIYAPFDGILESGNEGKDGYGLYVKITEDKNGECRSCILAHLSRIIAPNGVVKGGNLIALSGNTGFSTAPHLHWDIRIMKNGKKLKYNNGYKGAIDIFEQNWILKNEISHY